MGRKWTISKTIYSGGKTLLKKQRQAFSTKFIVPPFSVLDRRQGYWQNRKRTWLRLGIKSELGRDEHLCFNLNSFDADTDKAILEGQANWLRDIHDNELKALKVISLSIDQGTLVIGVK